jgi:Leucine-rich repeat (LRR) protein
LAGLSKLKRIDLGFVYDGGMLRSLEGISPGVTKLFVSFAPDLVSLAGSEGCKNLEKLSLQYCGVSSLLPLKASNIKQLIMYGCCLTSLESLYGLPLQSLSLNGCSSLTQLSGVEHLPALMSLVVNDCGVTSLQPLSQLTKGLQKLKVYGCKRVQQEVLELPNVQTTADVTVQNSNVREVVLAGKVGRAVLPA